MFSEEEIKAYKSVKAPGVLREKVLSSREKTSQKPLISSRKLSLVAACLIAVVGIGFTGRYAGHTPEIYFENVALKNGASVEESGSVSVFSRMAPVLSVPLSLETESTAEISVSVGVVKTIDGNPTVKIPEGREDVIWEVPLPDPEKTYEMEVKEKNKRLRICLEYQKETNTWVISRKN